jgi:NAD(P)-dependent dehydrogenase (short-subunit alcohol dehydrogenase family)
MEGVELTTPTVDLINASTGSTKGLPAATFVTCNVSSPTDWESAISSTVSIYGRPDILVNCAGIAAESTL